MGRPVAPVEHQPTTTPTRRRLRRGAALLIPALVFGLFIGVQTSHAAVNVVVDTLGRLPDITGATTIDGTGQTIVVDGSLLTTGDGFRLLATGATVRNMTVQNFPESGVLIDETDPEVGPNMDIHDNGLAGVEIFVDTNSVHDNVIHRNDGPGVWVHSSATANNIYRNSIFDNGGLGIDLQAPCSTQNRCSETTPDGRTANDGAGDNDSGGNDLQNFPSITNVTPTSVSFELLSTANRSFRIDAFASPPPAVGDVEGQLFLGANPLGSELVATDGSGAFNGSFNFFTPAPPGWFVTLTATTAGPPGGGSSVSPLAVGDPAGDTSEFSDPSQVPGGGDPGDPGDDDDDDGGDEKCQRNNHNNWAHPKAHDPRCPVNIRTEATPSTGEPGDLFRDKAWVVDASGGKGPKVEAPRGTITFYLCGPKEVTDEGCEKGTQVGKPQKVKAGAIWSPVAKGKLTAKEGKYCWRVYYSGDVNYFQKTHTNKTTECFRVRDDGPDTEL